MGFCGFRQGFNDLALQLTRSFPFSFCPIQGNKIESGSEAEPHFGFPFTGGWGLLVGPGVQPELGRTVSCESDRMCLGLVWRWHYKAIWERHCSNVTLHVCFLHHLGLHSMRSHLRGSGKMGNRALCLAVLFLVCWVWKTSQCLGKLQASAGHEAAMNLAPATEMKYKDWCTEKPLRFAWPPCSQCCWPADFIWKQLTSSECCHLQLPQKPPSTYEHVCQLIM